jgi:hypothetical protein
MTFREVVLAIDGLRDKDRLYRDWIRRATYIIGVSGMNAKWVGNKFDSKLWPIEKISQPTIQERAYEQLRKMREADAKKEDVKKVKEIINGRRPEDSSRG